MAVSVTSFRFWRPTLKRKNKQLTEIQKQTSFYEQKTLIRDSRRIKIEKSNKQLERQKTENKTCKIKHKRIGMSE